jgi:uncharacterized membrane protein
MDEDESILNAVLIACVIGIVIVVCLIVFYPRPSENFTALYFVNGSQYTKTPVDGTVSFNFTIENHEGKDMDYLIEYSVDNSTVDQQNVNIGKELNVTISKSLYLNDTETVHKIGLILNSNPDYEVHFWTLTGNKTA